MVTKSLARLTTDLLDAIARALRGRINADRGGKGALLHMRVNTEQPLP